MSADQFNCWAVYDATGEEQSIKMNDNGCLALFDIEEGAAAAVRASPGTAYKKVALYLRPPLAAEVALVEAFDAGRRAAQEEVHRLREWIKGVSAQYDICTHNVLKEICDGCKCERSGGES